MSVLCGSQASEGDSPEPGAEPDTESEPSERDGSGGIVAGAVGGAGGPGSAGAARFTEGDLDAVTGLVGLQTIERAADTELPQRLFLFEQLTRLDRCFPPVLAWC